ncbi:MAG: hydroxymethylbilane synthase [Chloroflexi bacterium]|nr:hydroxymethylbilane synthase [Chloroflexota bacterium]
MRSEDRVFRLGTRTSRLARIQTDLFQAAVQAIAPNTRCAVVGVSTLADRTPSVPIPDLGQGAFVKELEVALLEGEIDLAVHSLKDLPTALPPGLWLAAVMTRDDARDVLVSQNGQTLAELGRGARVGTGSPRRRAQILDRRPDLGVVMLRGNIDTRIRKVQQDGEVDAAVLAAAGLSRMGLSNLITEYLDIRSFLPAVGQGFLAIECREEDLEARAVANLAEDGDARQTADLERAFLAAIGGFCKTPMGAYALINGPTASMDGMVASLDGRRIIRARVERDRSSLDIAETGAALRDALYAQGAHEIIAAVEGV